MFRPHIDSLFVRHHALLAFCSTMFRPKLCVRYVSTTHCTRLFVRRCFDQTLYSAFCSTMIRLCSTKHIVLVFDDVSTCTRLFVRLRTHILLHFVFTMFRPHLALELFVEGFDDTLHLNVSTKVCVRLCFEYTLYSTFCSTIVDHTFYSAFCSTMFRPTLCVRLCFDHTLYSTFCSTMF